MSKTYKWAILIIIIVTAIIGIVLYSDDIKYYKITSFNIDASVKTNGDMIVTETTDYAFKGAYNGITISLPKNVSSNYYDNVTTIYNDVLSSSIYNNSGLTDVEIFVKDENGMHRCSEVHSANLGDSNVYTTAMDNDGYITYKIYQPSYNENRTFVIKYVLKNVVVKHKDIAELYWNFVGGRVESRISNLNITIGFATPVSPLNLSAYTHGNITGTSTVENSTIFVKYSHVLPYEYVGVRATFPLNIVKNATKHSGIAGIPLIDKQEDTLLQKSKLRISLNQYAVLGAIIFLLYWIFLLFKYEKDKVLYIEPDDELKVLDKYNPMIAACIAQNRDMHPRDIIAILINLVNKSVLKMDVKKASVDSDKKLYYLERDNSFFKYEQNIHKLDQLEKFVINIFFKDSNKIELASYINSLSEDPNSINKIKSLDKYVSRFLEEIGANKEKAPKLLLLFNNFIFGIICLFILFIVVFNSILRFSSINISTMLNNSNIVMFLVLFVLFLFLALPVFLYLLYFLLLLSSKLITLIRKNIRKLVFKISAKELINVSMEVIIISLLVSIILALTSDSAYILPVTSLFSIGLLIIKTDNLMTKHSKEILKDYFILKALEDKLYNGTFKEKNIESQIIWNKYLTYAIALGETNVNEYIKHLNINDDFKDMVNQLSIINYYSIYSTSRDLLSIKSMNSFYKSINSINSRWTKMITSSRGGSFSKHSGGSSFGGGGFSGGGGGGRWPRGFLEYS